MKNINASPAERWESFLVEYEKLVIAYNDKLSSQSKKETSFCREGCSACCSQVFRESSAHVEIIARRLESSPDLMSKFLAQNEHRKVLLAQNEEEVKRLIEIKDDQSFLREWLALRIPCALLCDNRCLVYDIRPITCAAYISLSPPRVCAIDPKGYLPLPMARIKSDFIEAVMALCRKFKIKPEMIYDLSWHLDRRLNPPPNSSGEET